MTATKSLLFFFNLVFWLCGLFLVAIGIWAQVDKDFVNVILRLSGEHEAQAAELSTYVFYMSLFLIALGGVISVIALFGVCGAARQSR